MDVVPGLRHARRVHGVVHPEVHELLSLALPARVPRMQGPRQQKSRRWQGHAHEAHLAARVLDRAVGNVRRKRNAGDAVVLADVVGQQVHARVVNAVEVCNGRHRAHLVEGPTPGRLNRLRVGPRALLADAERVGLARPDAQGVAAVGPAAAPGGHVRLLALRAGVLEGDVQVAVVHKAQGAEAQARVHDGRRGGVPPEGAAVWIAMDHLHRSARRWLPYHGEGQRQAVLADEHVDSIQVATDGAGGVFVRVQVPDAGHEELHASDASRCR
mmetsp:Transcript_86701/g.269482  ORF Transcript_86701/g.269482 Transcript_86701/m.269482 type:complete len:271 (+) Transcript_86701:1132-1944(+)